MDIHTKRYKADSLHYPYNAGCPVVPGTPLKRAITCLKDPYRYELFHSAHCLKTDRKMAGSLVQQQLSTRGPRTCRYTRRAMELILTVTALLTPLPRASGYLHSNICTRMRTLEWKEELRATKHSQTIYSLWRIVLLRLQITIGNASLNLSHPIPKTPLYSL